MKNITSSRWNWLLLGLGFLVGSLAHAADVTTVVPMKVTGLVPFKGHNLTVFYVSARESALGGAGHIPKVKIIKREPVIVKIEEDGTVSIPRTLIPKIGFEAFNYIVFAVPAASKDGFYLKNADGTYPSDPRASEKKIQSLTSDAFEYQGLWFLSLSKYEALQDRMKNGEVTVNVANDTETAY